MLAYKIDVIETLKESGYNSTRILRENILSQSAMQKLRKGEMIGIKTLEQLCELLDMQLGIAMAKIYDPQSNVSMPITGSIFNAMFILTFFLANGHITLIYLMVESFAVIPAGHIVIHQEMFMYCVGFVATLLTLALKLALPFIAVQFVVEVAVGILMKAIPQINVFVLNIQLKLFMGFMLIFSLTPEIAEFMDSMLLLLLDSLSRGIYQFFS